MQRKNDYYNHYYYSKAPMMKPVRDTAMRTVRVVALPLVLSVLLSACGGSGDTATSTSPAGGGVGVSPDPSGTPDSGSGTPDTGTDTGTDTGSGGDTPPTEPIPDTGSDTVTERSAVLVWNPPATNTDGSVLLDLQGYNIYQGSTAGNLHRVASVAVNQTGYTVSGLAQGTYYFAVSAYNRDGVESATSNVDSKTFTY